MTSLKIYGVPFSRASRTRWCAEELGLDYEMAAIHFADASSKTPEFLAINPNGKVPAVDDDGFVLWESMAINCYLAKKHADKGLWPDTLQGEAQVLQWSFWVVAELEKPLLAVLLNSPAMARPERNAEAAVEGERAAQRPLAVLEIALAKSPYLLGPDFTVADLNVAAVVSWGAAGGVKLDGFPHVAHWYATCAARPAARRAAPRRG
jgi:glutathione S-transferase